MTDDDHAGHGFAERVASLLETLADDRARLAELGDDVRTRILTAAGRLSTPTAFDRRRLARAMRRRARKGVRDHDRALAEGTEIRRQRALEIFPTPAPGSPPALEASAQASAPSDGDHRDASSRSAGSGRRDLGGELGAGTSVRPRVLANPRKCYVCKADYKQLHFHYDQLCPDCGDESFAKRTPSVDLRGRVAVITGARVKIGYQAAIMLLRCGARVVVTTRFPIDAANRYAREIDYDDWADRLSIEGVDLRHTPSVEAMVRRLDERLPHVDYLINNACQTVRRPAAYYRHLLAAEHADIDALNDRVRALLSPALLATRAASRLPHALAEQGTQPWQAPAHVDSAEPRARSASAVHAAEVAPGLGAHVMQTERLERGVLDSVALSQMIVLAEDALVDRAVLPEGALDADLQQVDLREHNSWRMRMHEVPTNELLEVLLVNSVAPFVLSSRLKPAMLRTHTRDKHIVQVSAMEGQFERGTKTERHPHTNMAKAALNMLTRTAAMDYVRDGIHMNAVDTGWVTDEDPALIAERKAEDLGFSPPLDIVDGAARIIDPIVDGTRTGMHAWGKFLKDFRPTRW